MDVETGGGATPATPQHPGGYPSFVAQRALQALRDHFQAAPHKKQSGGGAGGFLGFLVGDLFHDWQTHQLIRS